MLLPLVRRVSTVALGLAVAWPTAAYAGPAAAAPVEGEEDTGLAASDSPELAQAKALYARGKTAFDTTRYDDAIEDWTQAYATLSDTPENAPIKAALIYNLATAHERAFGIDHDPTHLRRAVVLMQSYAESIPALYGDGADAHSELEKIEERLEQMQAKLEQAEAETERRRVEEAAARGSAGDGSSRSDPTDRPDARPDPRARVLVITGATLAGAGVAGLGVMAGGLVLGARADGDVPEALDDRRDQFARGRTGNLMAYVGGAVGGALVVAGATLLGLGIHRSRTIALGPGPGQAGLALRARF
jgi:tetratricopeptide (TPR) repeat protein